MKKFFKFMKPYRVQFTFAVLFLMTECGLEILLPFLMNILVKNGIQETDTGTYTMDLNYVLIIGSIMIAIAIFAFFLGTMSAKFSAISCRGFGYEIRKEEYKKIQSYSFKNIDSFQTSSLITRLTTDVQIISDTLCTSLRPALRAPISMIFSLTFALIISPKLSLIFLVALIVLAAIMFTIIFTVKPKFKLIQKLVDNINRITQESIIAIKTIKAYVKKDYEVLKFNEANTKLKETSKKTLSINALSMPASQIANYTTILCILFFGGMMYMNASTAIALEDIQTFLTYVMQVLVTVMLFSTVLMAINRSAASLYRVNEVLSTESEIVDKKDSLEKINKGELTFKNVYFKYNKDSEEYILENINFSTTQGEFIGIVGQTGSSKSSLVSLIERFYDVTSGTILIDNIDIKDYSIKEVRNSISISFQSPILFKGTVLENLKWGNKDASMEEIIKACKIAECYDFIINNLDNGFDTMISQGGTSVSGGQRQRICIARALLKNPKILILDDSFSALDKITEAKVKSNIKKYTKNMTTIVISQKISTIQDADKIIVLDKGKITHIGNHDYLLENDEIYKDIALLQSVGGTNNGK